MVPRHSELLWGGPPPALASRRARAATGQRMCPSGSFQHLPTPRPPSPPPPATGPKAKQAEPGPDNAPQSPACAQRLRLPGAWLARPPVSPAKAWHQGPSSPSCCQAAQRLLPARSRPPGAGLAVPPPASA